jgi:hypothetical protein
LPDGENKNSHGAVPVKHDHDNSASDADLASAVPADGAAADLVAPDAAITAPAIDWRRVIAEAGLDVDEISFLTANRVQGIPQREVAAALGWAAAKAERIRKRVDRALARLKTISAPKLVIQHDESADPHALRGDSLRPFYLEHLPSGHRVWALSRSNIAMCPQLPFYRGPISKGESMNLEQQLKIESAKLDRISERLHLSRSASEEASRDLAKAQEELQTEGTAAVLEDRSANFGGMEKKILGLQATLRSRQSELSGAQAAHSQQAAKVEALQGEIAARHHADVVAVVRPKCARLAALHDEMCRLSFEIRMDLRGESVQPDELFATGEHLDTLRARFNFSFFATSTFLNELTMFNPKLRSELFQKYPTYFPESWAA